MSNKLQIITFGSFQISDGAQIITDATTKKSKIWNILKYLIAHHGKPVLAEWLADNLWADDENCADPAKALKDAIYRLRKTLDSYAEKQPYVLFSQGSYLWNPNADCWVDVFEFDTLLMQARDISRTNEERTHLYEQALALYNGPFLGDSTAEIWAISFTNLYRSLFLQAVRELADLYEDACMFEEITLIYDKAIAREPHEETLYVRQIEALIQSGEYNRARQQYHVIEKTLAREFGTKPSKSLEQLSYEIEKAAISRADSLKEITSHLDKGSKKHGAYFCGPAAFRQIYALDKRSEERISFPVYLGLLTLTLSPELSEDNAAEELKFAMKNLRQILVRSLRNGDIIAQYSPCQFILMLTAPDYNHGLAALNRIKFLFEKKVDKHITTVECQLSHIGKENVRLNNPKRGSAELLQA